MIYLAPEATVQVSIIEDRARSRGLVVPTDVDATAPENYFYHVFVRHYQVKCLLPGGNFLDAT